MTINLIDARRGLYDKCLELFADKNIAEKIYRYLCDGIEDCEEAEPKKGKWKRLVLGTKECGTTVMHECSECNEVTISKYPFCPWCGAKMEASE